MTADQLPELQ